MSLFWIVTFAIAIAVCVVANLPLAAAAKKALLVMTGIALVALVTLRPDSLPDTAAYIRIFEVVGERYNYDIGLDSFLAREYTTGVEYGFVLFIQFVKRFIADDARVFFFIVALLEIGLFVLFAMRVYRNDVDQRASFYGYLLPYFGLMYLLVTIRGGIALGLCLNAFLLTKDVTRQSVAGMLLRVLAAALLYFVAFTLHRMVVLFAAIELLYVLVPLLSKRVYLAFWLIGGLLLVINATGIQVQVQTFISDLSATSTLAGGYQSYYSGEIGSTAVGLRKILFWGIGILPLVLRFEGGKLPKVMNVYIAGIYLMSVLGFVLGSFRVFDFFFVFAPLLLVSAKTAAGKTSAPLVLFDFLYAIACVAIIARL